MVSSVWAANCFIFSCSWMASSLVGDRMRERTRISRADVHESRSLLIRGSAKAAVFPVPVRAHPMMSRPVWIAGIALA